MSIKPQLRVALVGNPNAGKTSLFNSLTGLKQKVGNFPGVTVEKKSGYTKLPNGDTAEIIDLPGTYSINPKSLDEHVVFNSLLDINEHHNPDVVVVVVDETNIKRNLLLFTQILDLGIPVVLALNMVELAKKTGINIDKSKLENELGIPVVEINARQGKGVTRLKNLFLLARKEKRSLVFDPEKYAPDFIHQAKSILGVDNTYRAFHLASQYKSASYLDEEQKDKILALEKEFSFFPEELLNVETMERYAFIDKLLETAEVTDEGEARKSWTARIDKILVHRIWGYAAFLVVLTVMFQAIFLLADAPMTWIDESVVSLSNYLSKTLPDGDFYDLISKGLVPGIGGVVIFIPQIAILFLLLSILEETGYMSRVMFLMDKFMKRFGMNGRSVVPVISGVACAVPAIMATRTIENWKERMITIFVTPLMSCSARLPVYVLVISIVVPDQWVGIFSLKGLALMGLYLLGFIATIFSAFIMNLVLKTPEKSFFILELPAYRYPKWQNVGNEVFQKSKSFVVDAGKVIVAISIVLWFLQSHGPGDSMEKAKLDVLRSYAIDSEQMSEEVQLKVDSKMLEASYIGRVGKFIEPAIEPIGFNWKIGISLITSFAAREVFNSTMAIIYSTGQEDVKSIREKMLSDKNPDTGEKIFTVATSLSLLVFFAFAMQCMSTLAVVYKETKSIKWPLAQMIYMTTLAYVSSFVVYQLFS